MKTSRPKKQSPNIQSWNLSIFNSGVPNGDNHENSGEGARENRGPRQRRYGRGGEKRARNSESGGKPAQGEKVNNFDN